MSIQSLPVCGRRPCTDVAPPVGAVPAFKVDPSRISIVMISEAQPLDPRESYYAAGSPLFARTTVAAFNDAGFGVETVGDIVGLGVYLTTAVKCAKAAAGIDQSTIAACLPVLGQELGQFDNVRVMLLMGDVAIRAINELARRAGQPRVVPAGATYRIRGGDYRFRGSYVLPSYLQAGPAFFIEKSKRRMIAEDIRRAFELAGSASGERQLVRA